MKIKDKESKQKQQAVYKNDSRSRVGNGFTVNGIPDATLDNWLCPKCKKNKQGMKMFQCDKCKKWLHPECCGITEEEANVMA